MLALTDITGLLGIASLMTIGVQQLPRIKKMPIGNLTILTASVFLISLIPFGGLPLAGYVRGIIGDLSITTLVLLWAALLPTYRSLIAPDFTVSAQHIDLKRYTCLKKSCALKQREHLMLLISASAIFLYPMTLGMSLYDPYRLGYNDTLFIVIVLFIILLAWLVRSYLIVLCLTLATLTWSIGWYESSNLWDYLIDPLVAIYATYQWVSTTYNYLRLKSLDNH